MAVYNIQNNWVSGICSSSGIPNNQKTQHFGNRIFPSSGEGRETPTLFGACFLGNPEIHYYFQKRLPGGK
jgi:hypothetical protein